MNAQPVSSTALPTGSSSFETFLRETGPSAKVVLGILLFFSLVSWLIIIAKYIRLKRVRGQSNRFLDFFRKSKRFSEVNTMASQLAETPLTTLFKSGYAERDAQRPRAPTAPVTNATTAPVSDQEHQRNRKGARARGGRVSRLTLADLPRDDGLGVSVHRPLRDGVGHHGGFQRSGCPARRRSRRSRPGSQALINTAAGLAAAIPALIAYNYFMGQIRQLRATMDDFALEFLNLTERNFTWCPLREWL